MHESKSEHLTAYIFCLSDIVIMIDLLIESKIERALFPSLLDNNWSIHV